MKKILITVAAIATTAFGAALLGASANAMMPQQPQADLVEVGETYSEGTIPNYNFHRKNCDDAGEDPNHPSCKMIYDN